MPKIIIILQVYMVWSRAGQRGIFYISMGFLIYGYKDIYYNTKQITISDM